MKKYIKPEILEEEIILEDIMEESNGGTYDDDDIWGPLQ